MNCRNLRLLIAISFFFQVSHTVAQPEPALAWAKTINSSGIGCGGLATSDEHGNVYVIASIVNTSLTVGGTTITSVNNSAKNAVIKYDQSGNGIWIKEIPFVFVYNSNTNPHKFLCRDGKLYLFTCYRQQNIVMDGFHFPPCQNTFAGDLVLIQLDTANGAAQWIRTITRPNSYSPVFPDNFEIFFDQESHIHALGTFSSTFILDNGDTLLYGGNNLEVDAFHAVYDETGTVVSAHKLGVNNSNPGNYSSEYFYLDAQKNTYRFVKDTRTFIKYDEQGTVLFTKTFTSAAEITGMIVDPWQQVFLSGHFSAATVSFDGITTSKNGGTTDAILIKFNSTNGVVEWVKNQGDIDCDRYDYITGDAIGNVYVLNNQYGWCNSPGASLLVKYTNDGEKIWQKSMDTHPGGNPALFPMVRAGNMALSPDGGTVIAAGYSQFSQSDQRGFIAQYGSCNTPQPVVSLSNSPFCQGDSAALIVSPLPAYRYWWSNGDTSNTTIYVSSPGNYSVLAIQGDECYAESPDFSIAANPLPDASVTIQAATLTALAGNTSYQWLDCTNNYASITGANNISFTPVQNGTYAVKLTSPAGCADTSACFTIDELAIAGHSISSFVSIYPNPASDEVTVVGVSAVHSLRILDLQGKEILRGTGNQIFVSSLSKGVYLLEIRTADGVGVKSFVKE